MIKRMSLMVVALAVTLSLISAAPAYADSFNYTYTGNDGVSASGVLNGSLIAAGEYLITSGTINVVGGPVSGSGTLVTNPNAPGTTTNTTLAGGGTFLTYDDLLFPGSNPSLDDNGLLFAIDGTAASIWGNGPGSSSLFEGNWAEYDSGVFSVSAASPAPEPGSLILLGTGILGFATVLRKQRIPSAN